MLQIIIQSVLYMHKINKYLNTLIYFHFILHLHCQFPGHICKIFLDHTKVVLSVCKNFITTSPVVLKLTVSAVWSPWCLILCLVFHMYMWCLIWCPVYPMWCSVMGVQPGVQYPMWCSVHMGCPTWCPIWCPVSAQKVTCDFFRGHRTPDTRAKIWPVQGGVLCNPVKKLT